jgi:hypothetical protein
MLGKFIAGDFIVFPTKKMLGSATFRKIHIFNILFYLSIPSLQNTSTEKS